MRHALLILVALAVVGCDDDTRQRLGLSSGRYELKQDKDGRTIRLDRTTGEMAVLQGDVLVAVKTPEVQAADRAAVAQLGTAYRWPPIELPNLGKGTTAYLSTLWRDNQLLYQFAVSASDAMRPIFSKAVPLEHFSIEFADKDGFEVLEIPIPLKSLTQSVDEHDKPTLYTRNAAVECSRDNYQLAVSWNVSWSLRASR